jgi:WhiB family redox-sensing transcriptional regulator
VDSFITGALGLLGGLFFTAVVTEIGAWLGLLAPYLIRRACRGLPANERGAASEEWSRNLQDLRARSARRPFTLAFRELRFMASVMRGLRNHDHVAPIPPVAELLPPGMAFAAKGACAHVNPEVFFPEKGGSTREAKRVCMTCSVRQECLDYAMDHDERFGIWGGLSERERRKLRERR